MKTHYISALLVVASCFSCQQPSPDNKQDATEEQKIVVQEFQTIIDSANVKGSVLVYDVQRNAYYSNDFEKSNTGHLPASTFKIANSIIALETGVVKNDSTLLKWNGEKYTYNIWEQDLILHDAFHYSCVPCYQAIARKIGFEQMNNYVHQLRFGNMHFDSSSIDQFWLVGESRITQFQQIDFLNRLYTSQLPIANSTVATMKRMMVIEKNDHYKLSGKTGWSVSDGYNNGWFVGYVETDGKIYFFATNIEPTKELDMDKFPQIRKELTYQALQQLNVIVNITRQAQSKNKSI